MNKEVNLAVAGILLVIGIVFISNTNLISWFPSIVHYVVGIIAVLGALFFGLK